MWQALLDIPYGSTTTYSALAAAIGLEERSLMKDLPVQVVSCGVPFLFVPLATRSAVDAIEDPAWASADGARYDLTRREREVLSLLAEHLSDREIADRLFLSTRTIERHVSNILLKMEAPNRRLAAAQAVRERLVATAS